MSSLVPHGTPVVLLNAFPLDRRQWEPLITELSERYPGLGDVISFDMPGIGDMPLPDEEPSLELIADAAVTAMHEVTGQHAAIWIGCSMGGYVAMAIVERDADAVAGLGLLGTKASADNDEARAKRLDVAAQMDAVSAPPDPGAMAEPLVGTQGPGREALVASVADNIGAQPADGIAWGQRAMAARPDRTAVLRAVDAPAVVIAGENDGVAPREATDEMAQALGVEPVVIDAVGHLCAVEAPSEVAQALAPLFHD